MSSLQLSAVNIKHNFRVSIFFLEKNIIFLCSDGKKVDFGPVLRHCQSLVVIFSIPKAAGCV